MTNELIPRGRGAVVAERIQARRAATQRIRNEGASCETCPFSKPNDEPLPTWATEVLRCDCATSINYECAVPPDGYCSDHPQAEADTQGAN